LVVEKINWSSNLKRKAFKKNKILKIYIFVHDVRAFDDDGTMCIDVKVRLKK
jgi:hypothetical protein